MSLQWQTIHKQYDATLFCEVFVDSFQVTHVLQVEVKRIKQDDWSANFFDDQTRAPIPWYFNFYDMSLFTWLHTLYLDIASKRHINLFLFLGVLR